jgi:hypothetical protein
MILKQFHVEVENIYCRSAVCICLLADRWARQFLSFVVGGREDFGYLGLGQRVFRRAWSVRLPPSLALGDFVMACSSRMRQTLGGGSFMA